MPVGQPLPSLLGVLDSDEDGARVASGDGTIGVFDHSCRLVDGWALPESGRGGLVWTARHRLAG